MSQEKNVDWAIEKNKNEPWYFKFSEIPVIRDDDLQEWEEWAKKAFLDCQAETNND